MNKYSAFHFSQSRNLIFKGLCEIVRFAPYVLENRMTGENELMASLVFILKQP